MTFAKYAGPELERSPRMVYLDQRGSGRSDRPKSASAYSIPIMVEDVEMLRRRLGVDRMVLVAHSFGTILALEYAAAHPDHVSRVVLASAVPDFPAIMDIMCARLARDDPQAFARAMAGGRGGAVPHCNPFVAYPGDGTKAYIYRNMFPNPETGRLVDAADDADGLSNTGESSAALFDKGLTGYRFDRPAAVTAPVLIVAGEADHQTSVEPQRVLAASLPKGRLAELRGRGHFMFVEDPTGSARLVVPFHRPDGVAAGR